VEPEPPEVDPVLPEPPPETAAPEIHDEPLDEPPIFDDKTDPENWDPNALPPADAPPNWARRPIGIGPGAPAASAPPAPKPAPKKPKGPTKKAAAKHAPGPEYPRRAAERGYEGKVELLVEVLPTGKIGKIEVTKSSGFRILDEEAVRTVRGWVFEAAMVEGRPVRSLVLVPFSFEFRERR
jgi:protein TonB